MMCRATFVFLTRPNSDQRMNYSSFYLQTIWIDAKLMKGLFPSFPSAPYHGLCSSKDYLKISSGSRFVTRKENVD